MLYGWGRELGDLGTWMGILTSLSSLTHRFVNIKQANGLLAMWFCRNEWFNRESWRVLIRRRFLLHWTKRNKEMLRAKGWHIGKLPAGLL